MLPVFDVDRFPLLVVRIDQNFSQEERGLLGVAFLATPSGERTLKE